MALEDMVLEEKRRLQNNATIEMGFSETVKPELSSERKEMLRKRLCNLAKIDPMVAEYALLMTDYDSIDRAVDFIRFDDENGFKQHKFIGYLSRNAIQKLEKNEESHQQMFGLDADDENKNADPAENFRECFVCNESKVKHLQTQLDATNYMTAPQVSEPILPYPTL